MRVNCSATSLLGCMYGFCAECLEPDGPVRDSQMTLEDALAARDEAIQRVDEHADPDWKDHAYDLVVRTAGELYEFTQDDVWDRGLQPTRENRALGPVFLRAARAGVCEKTDRVRPSARSHGSGKPVWRSLIHCSREAA
jgi:hypothetical protein